MDDVKEIVLESNTAILSGGVDLNGVPLITFPTDCADMIDLYFAGDILKMLQAYVDLAGGKVAVVADLRDGWTDECISKMTALLDELQASRRHSIQMAYFVKPVVKSKQRALHRSLSRCLGSGRMMPFYKCQRVESYEELYGYIERDQLTQDYGGTLQYNHQAWMNFHKVYTPVLTRMKALRDALPAIADEVGHLKQSEAGTDGRNSTDIRNITDQYEDILQECDVSGRLEQCREALDMLDQPENDPSFSEVHATLIIDTAYRLRQMLTDSVAVVDELDTRVAKTQQDSKIYEKLRRCKGHSEEVIETIDLLQQQITWTPSVGRSVQEAKIFREEFNANVLGPSKDIVACTTSILQELDTGKATTPRSYSMAFEIAKQLTEALQPFTTRVNELNETYTRIHLFHVILKKLAHWKQKASECIYQHLNPILHERSTDTMLFHTNPDNLKDTLAKVRTEDFLTLNNTGSHSSGTDDHCASTCYLDMGSVHNDVSPVVSNKIDAPAHWQEILTKFNHKHPPPKKKHIRLITKFAPSCIDESSKAEAETLAERTMFILSFLEKNQFKVVDIVRIVQWRQETWTEHQRHPGVMGDSVLEVTLV